MDSDIKPQRKNSFSSETTTDWRGMRALGLWTGLAAIAAIGGVSALSLGSNTSATQSDIAFLRPGNVQPNDQPSLSGANGNIDRSITTASVERSNFNSSNRGLDSIRLTLSSMQRQINALHARNDRLQRELESLKAQSKTDNLVTGSIQSSGPQRLEPLDDARAKMKTEKSEAQMALAQLSNSEMVKNNAELAEGINAVRMDDQSTAALDLGPGVSFDALRDRWNRIKKTSPDEIGRLNARAILRETNQGLQAHLIVGPLSSRTMAEQLCSRLVQSTSSPCKPSNYEGQKL